MRDVETRIQLHPSQFNNFLATYKVHFHFEFLISLFNKENNT